MEIKTGRASSENDSPAVVVPPDRGRPARRKTAQRFQRTRHAAALLLAALRLLVGISLIAGAGLAGFYAYRYAYKADLLKLRDISVVGCKHLDREAIETIVRQNFPANILRIDLNQLRCRLEQEPWIRTVEIRRVLPSSLKIFVRERVPCVVADIGGELELLDEDGILLDHYDPSYGKLDVPVFSGLKGGDPMAYQVLQDENSSRVKVGVRMLAELEEGSSDFARAISEVDLSDPGNVKVLLVDDTAEVILGDGDFLKKIQKFLSDQSKYKELKAQGTEIVAVDLRFDGKIVYRLKHPVAEQAEVKAGVGRN